MLSNIHQFQVDSSGSIHDVHYRWSVQSFRDSNLRLWRYVRHAIEPYWLWLPRCRNWKKNWNRFHPFCTRTCSAHSYCSHLPTAKVCQIDSSLPNYNTCVECKNPTDCKAIGFKNHICPEGFCKHPNPAGTDYFLTGSNYCHSLTGAGCYADTMRCWAGCRSDLDCRVPGAKCLLRVTSVGGSICSFPVLLVALQIRLLSDTSFESLIIFVYNFLNYLILQMESKLKFVKPKQIGATLIDESSNPISNSVDQSPKKEASFSFMKQRLSGPHLHGLPQKFDAM